MKKNNRKNVNNVIDSTWWSNWAIVTSFICARADYKRRATLSSCRRSLFIYSENTGVRLNHEPRQQSENGCIALKYPCPLWYSLRDYYVLSIVEQSKWKKSGDPSKVCSWYNSKSILYLDDVDRLCWSALLQIDV